jgi:hypothetical protein
MSSLSSTTPGWHCPSFYCFSRCVVYYLSPITRCHPNKSLVFDNIDVENEINNNLNNHHNHNRIYMFNNKHNLLLHDSLIYPTLQQHLQTCHHPCGYDVFSTSIFDCNESHATSIIHTTIYPSSNDTYTLFHDIIPTSPLSLQRVAGRDTLRQLHSPIRR